MAKKAKPVQKRKAKPKKLNLPDKPSDLMELALKDLKRVEKLKNTYKIVMLDWHSANSHCSVCMAGAVMTRVCNPDESASPYDDRFTSEERNKFETINTLRLGNIRMGLAQLNITLPWGMTDQVYVANYHTDRTNFYNDMERLVELLRRFDL
jgi:hypothetical protein